MPAKAQKRGKLPTKLRDENEQRTSDNYVLKAQKEELPTKNCNVEAASASEETENIRLQSKGNDLTAHVTFLSSAIAELIDNMEEKDNLVPVIVPDSVAPTKTSLTKDGNNEYWAKINQPDRNSTHKKCELPGALKTDHDTADKSQLGLRSSLWPELIAPRIPDTCEIVAQGN